MNKETLQKDIQAVSSELFFLKKREKELKQKLNDLMVASNVLNIIEEKSKETLD